MIVGAGFSGIAMAIALRRERIEDFVVLEREREPGGTWEVNTYPGCGCDVPSHLYSFSFAPNPDWTRTYSAQPEIRDYLRDCVQRFGVAQHLRLDHPVTAARWDEDAARWEVETPHGTFLARVLVTATGALAEPRLPDLPGLARFAGEAFHSARWNHDVPLADRRVAAIGTGASAIQFVPEIQPHVERLHVFQRTAPWVVPHSARATTRLERRAYRRLPQLQRLVRGGIYATRELLVLGFVKRPALMKVVELVARRHMSRQLEDPELRRKATPDYTIGCKRILPSNDWYPALAEPNVELVTEPIEEVREHAVVTADGVEREVDVIIFGTGFRVTEMPVAKVVRGRDGALLADVWAGSPHAHLGSAVPGFPNMFMLAGPGTGLGHSSVVYMIESQVAYVLDGIRELRARQAATVEVREDVEARFNAELDRRHEGTVWSTGCASWYLDAQGRNAALWPDWTWRFRQRTARFDPTAYELRGERSPIPVA